LKTKREEVKTVKRKMRGLIGLALLVVSLFVFVPLQNAQAAPPQAGSSGYSFMTVLSASSQDPTDTGSFSADVQAIYAWIIPVSTGGAVSKQFQVDVKFITPMGDTADATWVKGDTGNVTSIAQENVANMTVKNYARKQLNIAGTPNASADGQWTVNFMSAGKVVYVGNFDLAGNAGADDALVEAAQADLEKKGYTVTSMSPNEWDDGTQTGLVEMPMVARDPYSGETTQQIVDGMAAVRAGFPKALVLYCALEYSDQYQLVYNIKSTEWDAYAKSKNFNTFLNALKYGVWDVAAGQYIDNAKSFMTKNFGGGPYQAPGKTTSKQGTVASVKVQLTPNSLPPDGASTADVTVTVLDKSNKPVASTAVSLKVSGTGMGKIDPTTAKTNSKGQIVATYTAGKKTGSATITASVGTTSGTAVMTLAVEEKPVDDDAVANVKATLEEQGYTVVDVAYDATKTLATVVIDTGTPFDVKNLPLGVFYGMGSLYDAYPKANTLGTGVMYQTRYVLCFYTTRGDLEKLATTFKNAKNDKDKSTAIQNWLTPIYNNAVVLDLQTGKQVGSFKDFANKNFN
jgi:hypothetical protein